MTVLTDYAASILTHENLFLTIFADNWGVAADNVATLAGATAHLERFVQLLGMLVSNDKS